MYVIFEGKKKASQSRTPWRGEGMGILDGLRGEKWLKGMRVFRMFLLRQ